MLKAAYMLLVASFFALIAWWMFGRWEPDETMRFTGDKPSMAVITMTGKDSGLLVTTRVGRESPEKIAVTILKKDSSPTFEIVGTDIFFSLIGDAANLRNQLICQLCSKHTGWDLPTIWTMSKVNQ